MISVVIPAFNEEAYIKQCLTSLVNQQTTEAYEVIVVDNNSTDSTIQIVQKFNQLLNLKIIHEKVKGRGSARKRAFYETSGKIILSTDADAIVPAD